MSYIDIKDIAMPSRHLISAPSSPVQHPEQQKPVQQIPNNPIENSDNNSETNNATDILATPLGLGMANGYFSSLAEGRTLREDIRGYYFDILEKINNKWWQKAETLGEVAQQEGIIEILIGRDGKLLDIRQMRSTGSRMVDQAITDAITEAEPFQAFPASYGMEMFKAPLKISRPSSLFGGRNIR